jgi:L-xylulokinase
MLVICSESIRASKGCWSRSLPVSSFLVCTVSIIHNHLITSTDDNGGEPWASICWALITAARSRKAALFDLQGREIAIASCKADTEYPHPGWTERDMEVLWYSTTCAIREVLEKSGIRSEDIAGIGCAGHGNGVYLLDKQGQALRNGIQSMDSRAAGILAEWNEHDVHGQAFPYTIQSFWPAQPNALLAWMKRYEPENYARIGAVLFCKDYIKYRLTGEISTDFSDMSGSSLMDVRGKMLFA